MKRVFKIILMIALCVVLILGIVSCDKQGASDEDYYDGYDAGYKDGLDEGYYEGHWEGYKEGYGKAYYRFEESALHDAARYAEEYGGWHPEEAMDIIDAYEGGHLALGYMTVTEEDYKKAAKSLYLYYEYFYNSLYYEKMDIYN